MELSSTSQYKTRLGSLSLATLGVVFGDIGTSPLYAFRLSLSHIGLTNNNILGVLSLIFWALILIISIKYLIFILRADHDGEGGVIALLSLLKLKRFKNHRNFSILFFMSLFGMSLLFADGMITPAISVLSAVEGISIAAPRFHHFILYVSFLILLVLFGLQSKGTERVGKLFGPIMLGWFAIIAILGIASISHHPSILKAINPMYAITIFHHYHFRALLVLTGVFLAVTGGEALYTDVSHFGKRPIRLLWFSLVLPALLLNYFGQGADLLFNPTHLYNPFYLLAPKWFMLPLLVIATIATIIASQAVLSAVFSLAKQAIFLELLPRMNVIFSSHRIKGQVYIPAINLLTAIGTLGLLIGFQNSAHLAHAYGLAVNLDMLIVTILVTVLANHIWHWKIVKTIIFGGVFISLDLIFLCGNSLKVLNNGWITLIFAIAGTTIMLIWLNGLKLLKQASLKKKISIREISQKIYEENIVRVPGVAIFINEPYDQNKSCLFRQIDSTSTIHNITILLDIEIQDRPVVNMDNRIQQLKHTHGLYHIRFYYGYMQNIDIPNTLRICKELKILPFLSEEEKFIYYLEIVNAQPTKQYNLSTPIWCKHLFAGLLNNLTQNINFYHLPHNQTIMIGTYYDI